MGLVCLSGLVFALQGASPETHSVEEVLQMVAPLDVTRDFTLIDGRAIGLLAPEPVCSATLERAEWSPDGTRLLMVRRVDSSVAEMATGKPPQSKNELIGWDPKRARTVTYWAFDPDTVRVEAMAWLGRSDTVVIDTTWPSTQDPNSDLVAKNPRRHRVFILAGGSGQAAILFEGRNEEHVRLTASESFPRGALRVVETGKPDRYLIFGPEGPVSDLRPKKENRESAIWGLDTMGERIMRLPFGGEQPLPEWLNPQTGEFEITDRWKLEPPKGVSTTNSSSLEWSPLPGALGGGERGVLRLRLGKEASARLVVATDADGSAIVTRNGRQVPTLSPDGQVVLYRHQGVGMVRRLVRPNPETWARMREAWYRYRAIRDCAEASLAFDEGPSWTPGEGSMTTAEWLRAHPGWNDVTAKRLGDPSVVGRFARLPIPDEKNPVKLGEAIVGTANTPVGTARLRVNGTIEWLPQGG